MNAIAPALKTSDLADTVNRARQLLNEGDYRAALMLSGAAYDQARAAANFASRMKASDALVSKARTLQADAILIEAGAKIALAEDYDRAVREGQMAPTGRPRKEAGDLPTLSDVGLSNKVVFEARQLRRAEGLHPGFVSRCIQDRLEAGLEPSRAGLRRAIERQVDAGRDPDEAPKEARLMLRATGDCLGDLHWYELDEIMRNLRGDLFALEAVISHSVPSDPSQRIGETFSDVQLREIIERRAQK